MHRIDAHSHLPLDTEDGVAALDSLDLSVICICVDSAQLGGLDAQRRWYRALQRRYPQRFHWVTSFSLAGFGEVGWADQAIAQIDSDFADGACGCKVWKNVGMELRRPGGDFVFVDDPAFDPIWEHLAAKGRPLLMHIGEPLACWTSLDDMQRQGSPHLAYYRECPQWHWHGRSGMPSHAKLIATRDRVVEKHPKLTVIGAHYGSLEFSFADVAERLQKYPNFFVDTSSRLGDIALQAMHDRDGVREFFEMFADRILWGLDWVLTTPTSTVDDAERAGLLARITAAYQQEFAFFAGTDTVEINGRSVAGLGLPPEVLDKVFQDNARRVYDLEM